MTWGRFEWFEPLRGALADRFATEGRDGAHDLAHALRVAKRAEALAEAEHADLTTCVAAALLHDLVYRPKNHPESALTAAMAAEEAPAWCTPHLELSLRSSAIAAAIRTHSFSGGLAPTSLEGAVVQDADRLEALGAIGIARCFATGGAMGTGLWHPEDPWAEGRPLDDMVWSLDHFFQKLLRLESTFRTASGRALARRRTETLRAFLADLTEELS